MPRTKKDKNRNKNNKSRSNEMSGTTGTGGTPNPAGTTVQSQLDYFSNPENVKKAQAAVAAFRNSGKAKKNNNVKEKVKSNNSSTTKAKTKAQIIKEYEAEKARVKNIVDSSKGSMSKSKAELDAKNKAAANKTKAVEEAERKKSAVVGKTRKDIRREARDDKKARRRAGRTAKQTLKTPGGSITDEQNTANIAAEKAKIQKRREGRNQFLRNFGSQLTRGVQAGPKEGFKADKSGMNFYGGKKNEAAAESSSSDTSSLSADQKAFNDYASMQFDSISSKMGLTQDYDNKNIENAGFGLGSYKSSDYVPSFKPSSQNDDEDSNPTIAMKKIFKQKRGY